MTSPSHTCGRGAGPQTLVCSEGLQSSPQPTPSSRGGEEVRAADGALTRTPSTLRKVLKGRQNRRREVTYRVTVTFPRDWKFPGHWAGAGSADEVFTAGTDPGDLPVVLMVNQSCKGRGRLGCPPGLFLTFSPLSVSPPCSPVVIIRCSLNQGGVSPTWAPEKEMWMALAPNGTLRRCTGHLHVL